MTYRHIRRFLTVGPTTPPRWSSHHSIWEHTYILVQVFYAVSAYLLYMRARDFTHLDAPLESYDLLWPVTWVSAVGVRQGGEIIAQFGLGAALFGLMAWRYLVVRVIVSAALLQFSALALSKGAMNHGDHEWIWISVCLWLLPAGSKAEISASREKRMAFLTAVATVPAMILLFYSMSGAYKLYYAWMALLDGRFGGFSPEAMATTLARRALQTGSDPLWASVVMEKPMLGWPMYLALYYVELFAILIFFRPHLIRSWGVVLIVFHFGTLLCMDIRFPLHILINALFFVFSPFAIQAADWRIVIAELPLLGMPLRRSVSKRTAPEQSDDQVAA